MNFGKLFWNAIKAIVFLVGLAILAVLLLVFINLFYLGGGEIAGIAASIISLVVLIIGMGWLVSKVFKKGE